MTVKLNNGLDAKTQTEFIKETVKLLNKQECDGTDIVIPKSWVRKVVATMIVTEGRHYQLFDDVQMDVYTGVYNMFN